MQKRRQIALSVPLAPSSVLLSLDNERIVLIEPTQLIAAVVTVFIKTVTSMELQTFLGSGAPVTLEVRLNTSGVPANTRAVVFQREQSDGFPDLLELSATGAAVGVTITVEKRD